MSKTPTDKTIKEHKFVFCADGIFEKVGPGICKNVIMFIGVYLSATILHIAVQHCIRWPEREYIQQCIIFTSQGSFAPFFYILILWSSALEIRVPFIQYSHIYCECRLQVCRVLADYVFFYDLLANKRNNRKKSTRN